MLDEGATEPSTVAIRAFNDHVASDDRVVVVLLPVGDGVSLITHAG